MALNGREITVLGAGVAGLAVARALALRGAEVTVLEQAAGIREVGAGLQISPNGAAVLRALGMGDALAAAGTGAKAVELRDGSDGDLVTRLDLAALRPGQDYRFVHRADLIEMLADGARAAVRGRHDPCAARRPQRLIAGECRRKIRAPAQASRQHPRIFQRHVRALREEWQRRVRRVAQQCCTA